NYPTRQLPIARGMARRPTHRAWRDGPGRTARLPLDLTGRKPSLQTFDALGGDRHVIHVKPLEVGKRGEVFEPRVGDLRRVEGQMLELPQGAQRGQVTIGQR